MRKILMLLLTVASTGAVAGWDKVSHNDSGTFYADPDSVIKTGHKTKMRALHDYRTALRVAGHTFMSTEVQEEYDCKGRLSRMLSFTAYSRNFGKGVQIHTDTGVHDWESVKPGSVRESLWKFACDKK